MVDAGGQYVPPNLPPRRAAVTPRVRTSPGSGAIPLERVVNGFLDSGVLGIVFIHAPAGGGKTTALAHLRAALGDRAVQLHVRDESRIEDMLACPDQLTVATQSGAWAGDWLAAHALVPWGEDECIEYLAANHRPMVASVMSWLKDDPTRHALAGSPQLWTIVLDTMAGDVALRCARDALRHHLAALLPDVQSADAAGAAALFAITGDGRTLPAHGEIGNAARSLLRHHAVRLILAARHIARAFAAGVDLPMLEKLEPPDLIAETGEALRGNAAACARLASFLRDEDRQMDAAAASLLLAADPAWRPEQLRGRLLRRARLDGVAWAGIDLHSCDLIGASLREAHLAGATLDHAVLANSDCWHANFDAASLFEATASDVNFTGAMLRRCKAHGARFWGASFDGADLADADLWRCELDHANFSCVQARRASLRGARMHRTVLTDADLTDAEFDEAMLTDVDLRGAMLGAAKFPGAALLRCNLEDMDLPRADFTAARLVGSFLTGSRMPLARFRGARLNSAGLADIDWPGADLRHADFSGATFHMGSSRSGLVDSPIASEGTRTGFYTDDYNDQDFKPPEEIRKANLCGADLRGAKVENVDFYLVDLRGAKYTADQAAHFARCGAILRSRVA